MAALRMRSELAALHILDHALTQRGLRNRHGKLLRGVANPMILRRRRARRYLRSLDWLPHSRLQHPAKRVSPQRFSALAQSRTGFELAVCLLNPNQETLIWLHPRPL